MGSRTKQINYTMKLFSACAIVLVVVGHIPSTGFNGPFDMFKPYSFQVASFVFVSGYFYKEANESHPVAYLESRIKRLLIPLIAINAAYGCIVALLKRAVGIEWGGVLSVQSLLVMPFTDGHQFLINMPMWFIAPLFFAEIGNVAIRLCVKRIPSSSFKEVLLASVYLALGAVAIHCGGDEGLPSGLLLLMCRSLFFLACLGMGRCYAVVLEKYDTLPNVPFFAILFTLQLAVIVALHGRYTYIPSWCQFPAGILGTYFVTITGIAFLLRCCKLLAPAFGRSRFVAALADNTFSIMCHHIFGFFLVCSLFGLLSMATPYFASFDYSAYLSDWTYRWMPEAVPQTSLVYVSGGIFVSLVIHWGWVRIKGRWQKIWSSLINKRCRAQKNIGQ